jgi:hypothetical protein
MMFDQLTAGEIAEMQLALAKILPLVDSLLLARMGAGASGEGEMTTRRVLSAIYTILERMKGNAR